MNMILLIKCEVILLLYIPIMLKRERDKETQRKIEKNYCLLLKKRNEKIFILLFKFFDNAIILRLLLRLLE